MFQARTIIVKLLEQYRRQVAKVKWGPVWWCTSVIPVPGRLRQEDLEVETSMDYMARP
jgi:hypothetical protein